VTQEHEDERLVCPEGLQAPPTVAADFLELNRAEPLCDLHDFLLGRP